MTLFCNLPTAPDLPDAGEGMCCIGAAVYGPDRCTCWTPVYDKRQQKQLHTELEPQERTEPCQDCAYRSNSPEKAGDPGYQGDADELEEIAWYPNPFWCHQGMRHVESLVHPAGVEVPGHPAHYAPAIKGEVPYKANGQPADICAGWAARRRAVLREIGETMRYVYLGDRWTADEWRGKRCNPVRRPDGRCIVARGKQLVVFADGSRVLVIRRRLRVANRAA